MQDDLTDAGVESVHIVGVNAVGLEAGNAEMCSTRDIPWLQAVEGDDPWATWEVTFRDVVILDREGRRSHVFNVTENDLREERNYLDLRELLTALAAAE